MQIGTTAARFVLGAAFLFAGASAFFIGTPPPQPGLAGAFNIVFFASHWVLFVAAAQAVLGVLLLIGRFVPLALVMLAAFVYNSIAFHATMAPAALWAPAIVIALALPVAWPYRAVFALLFAAGPAPADRPRG